MSAFNDPLVDWPNEDMLALPASRDRLARSRPALLRVLDWPELRAAFDRHNMLAMRNKRWSHRQGVAAVLLSGSGVILLGASGELGNMRPSAILLALLLIVFGGLASIAHFTLLSARHHWLGHRFIAERLRQLLYQSLVGNFAETVRAMSDDVALAELGRLRVRWLDDLLEGAVDPRVAIRAVEEDRTEERGWLHPEWRAPPVSAPKERDAAELLEGLYRLRIGVQWTYAQHNLGMDVYSAPQRERLLRHTVQLASLGAVLASAVAVVAALSGRPMAGTTVAGWTVIAGTVSAAGLMAQSIAGGLQARADVERYQWYAEEVDTCREIFEQSEQLRRVLALRRLETASYRELRGFLRVHGSARFSS